MTIRRGTRADCAQNAVDDRIEQAGVGHDPEVEDREDEHRRDRRGLLQAGQDERAGLQPEPREHRRVVGTAISATSGDIRRLRISTSSTTTVASPSSASM